MFLSNFSVHSVRNVSSITFQVKLLIIKCQLKQKVILI